MCRRKDQGGREFPRPVPKRSQSCLRDVGVGLNPACVRLVGQLVLLLNTKPPGRLKARDAGHDERDDDRDDRDREVQHLDPVRDDDPGHRYHEQVPVGQRPGRHAAAQPLAEEHKEHRPPVDQHPAAGQQRRHAMRDARRQKDADLIGPENGKPERSD